MQIGDIVYYKYKPDCYIKYKIKKKDGDDLIVFSYISHETNWLTTADVIDVEQFEKQYNDEVIYE